MPSPKRIRKRKLPGPTARASVRRFGEGILVDQITNATPFSVHGTQVTVSEGHDWPPPSKGGPKDVGGNFFTQRRYLSSPKFFPRVKLTVREPRQDGAVVFQEYNGNILPYVPGLSSGDGAIPFPDAHEMSDDNMDEKGTVAIKRCKPGDPANALSTTLGELRKDGFPTLLGKSIGTAKSARSFVQGLGGEFLSFTFGYKPLATDTANLASTVIRASAALEQFERDAGRVVRRKYRFPIERSGPTESVVAENVFPMFLNGFPDTLNMIGKVVKNREVFQRVWFSGAFTYFLPPDWNSRNKMKEYHAKAEHLFEVSLTPETLWNLAPWSWATDWFAMTGDLISNLESFKTNGLVMHYGYVMVHTIVTDTYSHVPYSSSSGKSAYVPEVVLVTETKQRRKANPFGFGVTWEGLSPSQLAIAAALGISR